MLHDATGKLCLADKEAATGSEVDHFPQGAIAKATRLPEASSRLQISDILTEGYCRRSRVHRCAAIFHNGNKFNKRKSEQCTYATPFRATAGLTRIVLVASHHYQTDRQH